MRTILAGLLLAAAANPARAQMIWGGEYQRGLTPGAYVPHDGQPYMQRYNFSTEPNIYLNGNGWHLWYLDYLDRADRAYKFGYKMPLGPKHGPGAVVEVAPHEVVEPGAQPVQETIVEETPRVRLGFGVLFGRFRTR